MSLSLATHSFAAHEGLLCCPNHRWWSLQGSASPFTHPVLQARRSPIGKSASAQVQLRACHSELLACVFWRVSLLVLLVPMPVLVPVPVPMPVLVPMPMPMPVLVPLLVPMSMPLLAPVPVPVPVPMPLLPLLPLLPPIPPARLRTY